MKEYKKLVFEQRGDERGQLVIAECGKQIPFDIKRIFYMYDSKEDVVRGRHANRNSEFVFINLKGSCRVLIDNGFEKEVVVLDEAHKGIYLEKMTWKEMYDFTPDSVFIVLSNEKYDADEYIRDYGEFLDERRVGHE